MNFFAHVYVARRVRREPAFLLGTMLPDFATMCGARLGRIVHAELASGVAEHHRTDEAFHAGATFVALCRDVSERLDARGLTWGASRAAAHVGTELLLDGELTADEDAGADYLRAIAAAADEHAGTSVVFRDPWGRGRFEALRERLTAHGAPTRYRDPAFVTEILVRILSDRPRLAIAPGREAALGEEMVWLASRVAVARGALVGETLEALGAEPRPADQGDLPRG